MARPGHDRLVHELSVPGSGVSRRRPARRGILTGVPLGAFDRTLEDCLVAPVTEKRTRAEIDAFAAALAAEVA